MKITKKSNIFSLEKRNFKRMIEVYLDIYTSLFCCCFILNICFSSCLSCTSDADCGFCYALSSNGDYHNTTCLPTQPSSLCETKHWVTEFCPNSVSWMTLGGLMLYLACFAPGVLIFVPMLVFMVGTSKCSSIVFVELLLKKYFSIYMVAIYEKFP